jgi:putative ABC transport system substrate-binding protein
VTGLSDFNLGVVTKRLDLLKEVVPSAARVAVLWNPGNPTNPLQLKELEAPAASLRIALLSSPARRPDDIDRAFATMRKERADALLVLGDPMFGSHTRRIADAAAGARLPSIWGTNDGVDAGGLLSYGANFDALFRRAAVYVDKVLKGTPAGDIPVEQPTTFELVVNAKTAGRLGITIPPSVLYRADRVRD